ncbi:spore germination protein PF [Melghiribacillus thermohalophilus]|uniref:Spore germination protein PF n=1 Tax=Melghiribacillus thermohalophilus TaxID=1324956 RepID=A0A4R3MPJ2_9BACI|nr:spore germination protein [Melghiribacillus thermohalophilus]TCT16694.1 spore germination protein PF [Melghiribacillus thermohalophilus]
MPSVVGPIKVNSVSGGVMSFGDSFYVSPKSSSKTNTGSGSLNTGDFLVTNNMVSTTNPFDPDIQDQGNVGNA